MLPFDTDAAAAAANNLFLIATIDSDIANIPDNEFASVFAGGIVVMFGGLFSALFVGWIIDSRNLYANIVADSYAQGGDDEEFWKGLSEEEKIKTREMLAKLKKSNAKPGRAGQEPQPGLASLEVLASQEDPKPTKIEPAARTNTIATEDEPQKEKKDVGMFSDY